MSFLRDVRRQKKIQAAEGYLELVLGLGERWSVQPEHQDRMARRALRELSVLDREGLDAAHIFYLQGQAFRALHQYRDAIEPFRLALQCDPGNTGVHLALGWCFKRIDRLDLAIQALEEAMEIAPDQGILHYNLACYWALAKNGRMAVKYLHQSFEIDPNYRDRVAEEADFDPVRHHAVFQSLISVIV